MARLSAAITGTAPSEERTTVIERGARRLRRLGGAGVRHGRLLLRTGSTALSAVGLEARRSLGWARLPGEEELRARLLGEGASLRPRHPAPVWRPWLNAALRTLRDVELARAEVTACGLPPHPDNPKNWDLLIALGLILERYSRRARVLDAGATQYSRLLPWLYLYGFRNLHGIDLVYKRPIQAGPIRYEQMDLTRTQFRDRSFDAITCLSVIEHGVDPEAYLREMSRLLRPGGLLVTSTDFWCEPLDLVGKSAYGVPVKIFGPSEVESLVRLAGQWDLHLAGELDLRCQDKAVDWTRMGLQYTFVNVVLKKARGRRRDRT